MLNLRAELATSIEAMEAVGEAWTGLAETCGEPYAQPGWVLAWWRHAAPARSAVRTVFIWDGSTLVGVLPMALQRRWGIPVLRLAGAGVSSRPAMPVLPGFEQRAAEAGVPALLESAPRPRVVLFEGLPGGSPWPSLFESLWPHGRRRSGYTVDEPTLHPTVSSAEEWFAAKSRNYRQKMRRGSAKLTEAGATFVRSDASTDWEELVTAFAALHRSNWEDRGGTGVLSDSVEQMIRSAARTMAPDHLAAWSLVAGGEFVAVHLVLTAGDTATYWLGGYDPEWERLQPSLIGLHHFTLDAVAGGYRTISFGSGAQPYKYRFADDTATLRWSAIGAGVVGRLAAAAFLLPGRLVEFAARVVPPRIKRRIRMAWGAIRALDPRR